MNQVKCHQSLRRKVVSGKDRQSKRFRGDHDKGLAIPLDVVARRRVGYSISIKFGD